MKLSLVLIVVLIGLFGMSRSMPTSQKVESSNVISELESADLDLVLQNPNGAHGRDKREFLLLPFLWIPPFSTRPATEEEVRKEMEEMKKKRN